MQSGKTEQMGEYIHHGARAAMRRRHSLIIYLNRRREDLPRLMKYTGIPLGAPIRRR